MSARLRVIVGVMGHAGHALPAIALAAELRRRGHGVLVQTFERWRALLEEMGVEFDGSRDRIVRATDGAGEGSQPGIADTARTLQQRIGDYAPDFVVSDALTLSPALAAEKEGVPHGFLFPEVYPVNAPGLPAFSLGLFPPRTRLGSRAWRALGPVVWRGSSSGGWHRWAHRRLTAERIALGLPPRARPVGSGVHRLSLVATFPQLEYPRQWPADVHVTGPMILDPPHADVELPSGTDPLVVVAPSTVKDPERRLARVALEALAREPVRVLVTTSGGSRLDPGGVPENATIVDWVSYPQAMAEAQLVVCGGNHGTVVSALSHGVPVVVSPAMPDDAEHGARVAWAGAGAMVPGSLLRPATLRAATRLVLRSPRFAARARAISAWARENSGPARGAELIERYASSEE